ncbi:MAG: NAD(P)H-dependent oxidoreductase subunit E [Candidatus Cloacimonetes bacterium]|jgi:NADH-quinone oxidoreductase subunit E|nr:NAD(P)H-dependent oxidoreductase subunit E [Candidatus Cloacimonadota bacterium]MDD4155359.1 NAD(P)H-dependent oxidoreductase subunit E [Candidatus Cloacimonadota bacterium]
MEQAMNESLDWLDEIIEGFGSSRTSLIPVLQSVQSKYRYLPEHVMSHISEKMALPLSNIYGVATFYAQFSTQPKGKHIVQVCDGTACHVRGAKDIISRIRKDFKLDAEKNTTDDKLLTLETVACIGACAMAPAVIVDGHVYGHMTPDKMMNIISEIKEEETNE